jgi:uncharacterized protein
MAVVQCPTCGDSVTWGPGSPFRPFCSDRCKNADLGAWASERYAIESDDESDIDARDESRPAGK